MSPALIWLVVVSMVAALSCMPRTFILKASRIMTPSSRTTQARLRVATAIEPAEATLRAVWRPSKKDCSLVRRLPESTFLETSSRTESTSSSAWKLFSPLLISGSLPKRRFLPSNIDSVRRCSSRLTGLPRMALRRLPSLSPSITSRKRKKGMPVCLASRKLLLIAR